MHWRDELITTTDRAKAFLYHHVNKLDLPELEIESTTKYGLGIYAQASLTSTPEIVFNAIITTKEQTTLERLSIQEDERRNGLGSKVVKALIAIAYDNNDDVIAIKSISKNAGIFWSALGATLIEPPTSISEDIYLTFMEKGNDLTLSNIKELKHIKVLAEQNSDAAFRALSQSNLVTRKKENISQILLSDLCHKKDMMFDFNDPTTLELLNHRIGKIPDFSNLLKRPAINSKRAPASYHQ